MRTIMKQVKTPVTNPNSSADEMPDEIRLFLEQMATMEEVRRTTPKRSRTTKDGKSDGPAYCISKSGRICDKDKRFKYKTPYIVNFVKDEAGNVKLTVREATKDEIKDNENVKNPKMYNSCAKGTAYAYAFIDIKTLCKQVWGPSDKRADGKDKGSSDNWYHPLTYIGEFGGTHYYSFDTSDDSEEQSSDEEETK